MPPFIPSDKPSTGGEPSPDRVRDIILNIAYQRPLKRRVAIEVTTIIAALLDEMAPADDPARRQSAMARIDSKLIAWVEAIDGMRFVASNS